MTILEFWEKQLSQWSVVLLLPIPVVARGKWLEADHRRLNRNLPNRLEYHLSEQLFWGCLHCSLLHSSSLHQWLQRRQSLRLHLKQEDAESHDDFADGVIEASTSNGSALLQYNQVQSLMSPWVSALDEEQGPALVFPVHFQVWKQTLNGDLSSDCWTGKFSNFVLWPYFFASTKKIVHSRSRHFEYRYQTGYFWIAFL